MNAMPFLVSFFYLIFITNSPNKFYEKEYYSNANLKAEGWIENGKRVDYWFEYEINGHVKKQGPYLKGLKHGFWFENNSKNYKELKGYYSQNKKTGWWTFTLYTGEKKKIQYKNNIPDGLVLYFKKGNLRPYKAERFKEGKYLGSWLDYSNFKKDNPNFKMNL